MFKWIQTEQNVLHRVLLFKVAETEIKNRKKSNFYGIFVEIVCLWCLF